MKMLVRFVIIRKVCSR